MFFEHTNGNEANTESLENSPPLANASVVNNINGLCRDRRRFGAQFPLTVNAIPTKAIWPYVQQWHLDVQREVVGTPWPRFPMSAARVPSSTGKPTTTRFPRCRSRSNP